MPALPVRIAAASSSADLGDRADMVYMNTNVTRGTGELVVTGLTVAGGVPESVEPATAGR